MVGSERDRISVDLRGLKASLCLRAREQGVSPSRLLRELLSTALVSAPTSTSGRSDRATPIDGEGRVRISLHMTRSRALMTMQLARRAGMSPGDYVADLVAGVPVLASGKQRDEHLAALVESSAELATVSRSIHHLVALLRQGEVRAALEYRGMLDSLEGLVREHLNLASATLAELRPRGTSERSRGRPAQT